MTGKTHLMGGVAATIILTHTNTYDPLLFISAGAIGALLPDICHSGSKIGRRFKGLSKLINKLFGHRTITHSLLFLILMNMLVAYLTTNEGIRVGILIGMVSHFLLDAATKNGIKLLYPLKLTIRFPLTIRTGDKGEAVVMALLSLLVLYYSKDVLIHYLY